MNGEELKITGQQSYPLQSQKTAYGNVGASSARQQCKLQIITNQIANNNQY
ncbi:hypothetical protein [Chakrabartyella piscis]|uniref:hypothetical protein n=1 Tax=Chakrabartyella piscis TaxID=2918914 RepID=UPI002958AD21|nr:hypothetical protein [Chakrabartyella piscis]